jgi:SNW domain-containing protein 1
MLKGTSKLAGDSLFDSRLFNQTTGMDSGFGAEDEYTTYTKPLFDRGEAESIYRPKKNDSDVYGEAEEQLAKLSNTSRFRPDKGFKGAEANASNGPRSEPVQFEKAVERDPYERKSSSSDHNKRDRDRDDASPARNKRSKHSQYSDDD